MKILAIIPARGGSQSIPKKNIALLAGKPLISYTIKAAQQSKYIDKTVVSSDDEEILSAAQAEGAEPIKRPGELANNTSKMDQAMKHALAELKKQDCEPDLIVLLQPTSPLRSVGTIDGAIAAFIKNQDKFDSLIPLAPTSNKVGTIEGQAFKPKYPAGAQRQELEALYYDCGTIHIFKPKLINQGDFFGKNIFAFPIPWPESLDIDTPDDIALAEYYLAQG